MYDFIALLILIPISCGRGFIFLNKNERKRNTMTELVSKNQTRTQNGKGICIRTNKR